MTQAFRIENGGLVNRDIFNSSISKNLEILFNKL